MTHTAIAYNVYFRGRHVTTVWFTGYTAAEVRQSLVDHDGYPYGIRVVQR